MNTPHNTIRDTNSSQLARDWLDGKVDLAKLNLSAFCMHCSCPLEDHQSAKCPNCHSQYDINNPFSYSTYPFSPHQKRRKRASLLICEWACLIIGAIIVFII